MRCKKKKQNQHKIQKRLYDIPKTTRDMTRFQLIHHLSKLTHNSFLSNNNLTTVPYHTIPYQIIPCHALLFNRYGSTFTTIFSLLMFIFFYINTFFQFTNASPFSILSSTGGGGIQTIRPYFAKKTLFLNPIRCGCTSILQMVKV